MKIICLLLSILFLYSCSEAPEQKSEAPVEANDTDKSVKKHPTMKGHQDLIQRAKDMEKEVLKAAEKQKKIIDDLDG